MKRVSLLILIKRILISIILIILIFITYVRFNRTLDSYIYHVNVDKVKFTSKFEHNEYYLELKDQTTIHSALFKPKTSYTKATIFHHLGNAMTLNNAQLMYESLLNSGYQIFAYERRGFSESSGKANNSKTLKNDALEVFDQFKNLKDVKGTPIIIWGVSMGGIFATTNAVERASDIKGLIIESAFSSFSDVAKHYANEINLENYRWLIPILLNNDFPTYEEIQQFHKSTVIIHSTEDQIIPFKFAEKIYGSSNKKNTFFWKIKGSHIKGIFDYKDQYLKKFDDILTN
ncbi:alpha/beta hydrolase [Tenacibaculum jejuense]|uniref:Serine aminopeptidase S33 domain-containing protein n=1 Tax=Tenacibaculum jejuense TaxID=584609 RepID=A0A238U829_9FLAO|nr:alpha/beta fold hydrolase [Tenacibaculum jejuense]SNR15252.1 Probable transmembrane protein of unknown function. Putative hydrolase [Tenacibaculum jejuense]